MMDSRRPEAVESIHAAADVPENVQAPSSNVVTPLRQARIASKATGTPAPPATSEKMTPSPRSAAKAAATPTASRPTALKKAPAVPLVSKLPTAPVDPPSLSASLLPPPPMRRQKRSYGSIITFLLCVVAPVIGASIYFFGYASNQYVAEFKFAISDSKSGSTVSSVGGLASFMGMGATAGANPQESYIVADFLKSRQVVDDLDSAIDVRHLYSRPEADWWSRFDQSLPVERFVSYWKRVVTSSYDQITGIGTAEVRAFTPEDAYLIATTLVRLSEELVNKIANRPQRDAVRFAEADLQRAEERLKDIRGKITRFRNTEQVIDPQSNVVTSNVALAQSLRATLNQLQTDLASLEKERTLSRNAPAIVSLRGRITATQQQLASVEGQVANMRDGANPLSRVVADFEQLDLERQFAQNMVLSSLQKLDDARAALLAQHVYVTPYVSPAMPQSSTYPKRILSIITVALVCFLFWTVGLLVVRSIREHLN